METTKTKAQEAFDSAKDGKRVGVLCNLSGDFADSLYQCYRDLDIVDRMGLTVQRRHASLELDWQNGGKLYIHPNPDSFRGMSLDRMFIPAYAVERSRLTVTPTLAVTGGELVEF